jgi:DNA-binding response OmpR family regulator
MSRLVPCRAVGGLSVKRNDELQALLIGDELIGFTGKEYDLLLQLLEHDFSSDKMLMEALYHVSVVDKQSRLKLDRHVDNIKRKLKPTGLTIRRVHRAGYTLLVEETDALIPASFPMT